MGSTFVTLSREDPAKPESGFWMKDGLLEVGLRLLALHLPEPTDSGEYRETLRIRNQWLLASRGYFSGCIPHGLEDACKTQEGRIVVRMATESLLDCLQRSDLPLDVDILGVLDIETSQFNSAIERKWLIEIGWAFLDLLDGKISSNASAKGIMPGSIPYQRHTE